MGDKGVSDAVIRYMDLCMTSITCRIRRSVYDCQGELALIDLSPSLQMTLIDQSIFLSIRIVPLSISLQFPEIPSIYLAALLSTSTSHPSVYLFISLINHSFLQSSSRISCRTTIHKRERCVALLCS